MRMRFVVHVARKGGRELHTECQPVEFESKVKDDLGHQIKCDDNIKMELRKTKLKVD